MQSWEVVVDAVQVVDELSKELSSISSGTDECIVSAKNAQSLGDTKRAADLLLRGLETAGSRVALQASTLKRLKQLLQSTGSQLEAQETRIAELERRVGQQQHMLVQQQNILGQQQNMLLEVQQEHDRARQARGRTLQKALLHQSAYALASVVEAYVYQGEDTGLLTPLSLTQLDRKAKEGDMEPLQLLRYRQAIQALTRELSISPQQLLAADKYLRKLTFNPAHGSNSLQNVGLDDLLLWAGVHCSVRALQPVQAYIRGLTLFSATHPLRPDKPLEDIL